MENKLETISLKREHLSRSLPFIVAVLNIAVFIFGKFIQVLEKTDKDMIYYTLQIQNLILNIPSDLMYPMFRIFIPGFSIVVAKITQLSFYSSMQVLSVLFLFFIATLTPGLINRNEKTNNFITILILSCPVVILYTGSYFVEIPFYFLLISSFWLWEQICVSFSWKKMFIMALVTICGVMTKESFLFHLIILIVFTLVWYPYSLKKIAPYLFLMIVIGAATYFGVYQWYFESKHHLLSVVNTPLSGALEYNLHHNTVQSFLDYFMRFRQGFLHMLINLALAFGSMWIIFSYAVHLTQTKLKTIVYFGFLFILLIFITYQVNPAQKYAFLCFAPSIFWFLERNINVEAFTTKKYYTVLAVNYLLNFTLISVYGILKIR